MESILKARETWWRNREKFYSLIVPIMALVAIAKLGDEFIRLLFEFHNTSAIDLKIFHILTNGWISGVRVYEEYSFATHPPANYLILWPFFGALPLIVSRILWALLSLLMLWWLAGYSGRFLQSADEPRSFRRFAALIIFALNGTGVAIGNGQIPHAILILIILSLELISREEIAMQFLAGVAMVIALVKPTITAPFYWILLFLSASVVPALTSIVLYGAITLFAANYQSSYAIPELFQAWLDRAITLQGGYGNLHSLLQGLGQKDLLFPIQLVILVFLGIWIFNNRSAKSWVLLGVTSIVARFWTYHRVYDDILIFLAILALFKMSKELRNRIQLDFAVEWLAIVNVFALMLPARMRYWPSPFEIFYKGGHVLIWLVDLAILFYYAWKIKNEGSAKLRQV